MNLLHAKVDGAQVVRICELTPELLGWLHEHVDYERGLLMVDPPVLSAQPARWLSAMRWIGHCWAQARKPKG